MDAMQQGEKTEKQRTAQQQRRAAGRSMIYGAEEPRTTRRTTAVKSTKESTSSRRTAVVKSTKESTSSRRTAAVKSTKESTSSRRTTAAKNTKESTSLRRTTVAKSSKDGTAVKTVRKAPQIKSETVQTVRTSTPQRKQSSSAGEERKRPRMSLVESERTSEKAEKRRSAAHEPAGADGKSARSTASKSAEGREKLPSKAAKVSEGRGKLQNTAKKKSGRRKKNSPLRMVLYGLGGMVLIAYIAVAVYFGSHFYEDTEIYGIDCSQKTVEEVKALVEDKLDDYQLKIEERGGAEEFITAPQIDLQFVDNSSIDRMLKAQRSYLWPITMLLERNQMASVAFSYDQEKALTALRSLECMNPIYVKSPTDAYLQVTDQGYEIVSETEGNALDQNKTQSALFAALDAGKSTLSFEAEDCYIKPEIYQDDKALNEEAEAKNELLKADITYDFGDRQERVNAPVIAEWITQMTDGGYVIDEVKVMDYVESLALKYDTFGLPRTFYTTLGTTVTLSDGDYGWCIDQSATLVDLLNAIGEGYQGTMEPQYLYTATSRNTDDIGYTYVEICISQQRMWCYKDGVCIVDTPIVTGNPNKGNATPSNGVWSIDAKMREYTLVGEGYRSPVDYWMPFNGDIGIHDMQNRAYFGSTIYLTNGSHGCINTPYDAVKVIYENVSIGTAVVVYD